MYRKHLQFITEFGPANFIIRKQIDLGHIEDQDVLDFIKIRTGKNSLDENIKYELRRLRKKDIRYIPFGVINITKPELCVESIEC